MSHKCNDYVIKDGEFIRNFQKMYEEIQDPWDQKSKGVCINFQIALLLIENVIKQRGNLTRNLKILDVGCANGYQHTELLRMIEKNSIQAEYIGTDISQTVIEKAKNVLNEGGTILYPTDTIWGIGCDATNDEACKKILDIKNRPENKSFIVLVDSIQMLEKYTVEFPEVCYDLVEYADKPLTIASVSTSPGATTATPGG